VSTALVFRVEAKNADTIRFGAQSNSRMTIVTSRPLLCALISIWVNYLILQTEFSEADYIDAAPSALSPNPSWEHLPRADEYAPAIIASLTAQLEQEKRRNLEMRDDFVALASKCIPYQSINVAHCQRAASC
jgi:hypothetical protein